eukprot:TRINITY_DN7530_c0_g1_i3.p1 TRINITY_DN7530_c0_g1~~TRINITY_DN7530_c0_g1_i3.p1  ORF type:complete len:131 (-),score=7.52 TRINITY_DN7530_c0_g1_i3:353-724(-)
MEEWGVQQVYLLSDVHLGKRITSSTLDAWGDLSVLFQTIERVHEALAPVLWEAFLPTIVDIDSGILGILDKLVAHHAKLFLVPPLRCGGMGSSFTREIIDLRLESRRPSRTWEDGSLDLHTKR